MTTPPGKPRIRGDSRPSSSSSSQFFPLHSAILRGDKDGYSRMLLEGKEDINALNKEGFSALQLAALVGNVEAVKLLLESGADPRQEDARGDNPLFSACLGGDVECVKVLIAAGCPINTYSSDGLHASQVAEEAGHMDVVRFFHSLGFINGLDFSRGVMFQSPLLVWEADTSAYTLRYAVLSRLLEGFYFWKGNKGSITGSTAGIPVSSIRRVHQSETDRSSFSIQVTTGRLLHLSAPSEVVANQWIESLQIMCRERTAAFLIAAVIRRWKAYGALKRYRRRRDAMLKLVEESRLAMLRTGPLSEIMHRFDPTTTKKKNQWVEVNLSLEKTGMVESLRGKSKKRGRMSIFRRGKKDTNGILSGGKTKKKWWGKKGSESKTSDTDANPIFAMHNPLVAQPSTPSASGAVKDLSRYRFEDLVWVDQNRPTLELRVVVRFHEKPLIYRVNDIATLERWTLRLLAVMPNLHEAAVMVQSQWRRLQALNQVRVQRARRKETQSKRLFAVLTLQQFFKRKYRFRRRTGEQVTATSGSETGGTGATQTKSLSSNTPIQEILTHLLGREEVQSLPASALIRPSEVWKLKRMNVAQLLERWLQIERGEVVLLESSRPEPRAPTLSAPVNIFKPPPKPVKEEKKKAVPSHVAALSETLKRPKPKFSSIRGGKSRGGGRFGAAVSGRFAGGGGRGRFGRANKGAGNGEESDEESEEESDEESESDDDAAENWVTKETKSGEVYYYNRVTKEKSSTPPWQSKK